MEVAHRQAEPFAWLKPSRRRDHHHRGRCKGVVGRKLQLAVILSLRRSACVVPREHPCWRARVCVCAHVMSGDVRFGRQYINTMQYRTRMSALITQHVQCSVSLMFSSVLPPPYSVSSAGERRKCHSRMLEGRGSATMCSMGVLIKFLHSILSLFVAIAL